MSRIDSAYRSDATPPDVAIWEKKVGQADTDAAALMQLTYQLALQVRTVKQLLIWMMIVIPVVAAVFLFVLGAVLEQDTSSTF